MPETMPRSIRIPDDLWFAALKKARRQRETLSDVVRRALEEYIKKP